MGGGGGGGQSHKGVISWCFRYNHSFVFISFSIFLAMPRIDCSFFTSLYSLAHITYVINLYNTFKTIFCYATEANCCCVSNSDTLIVLPSQDCNKENLCLSWIRVPNVLHPRGLREVLKGGILTCKIASMMVSR